MSFLGMKRIFYEKVSSLLQDIDRFVIYMSHYFRSVLLDTYLVRLLGFTNI